MAKAESMSGAPGLTNHENSNSDRTGDPGKDARLNALNAVNSPLLKGFFDFSLRKDNTKV
jgi:hypothetical protein